MKKLLSYSQWIYIHFRTQFAYRGIILESVFDFLVRNILLYYIWKVVYECTTIVANRTYEQMIAYALTSSMIISLLSYPDIHFLAYDIKHGGIAYSLLKPMDFQLQFLLKDTGIALAYFIALFPVCVAAMFVLNTSVDLTSNWPCFIISLTIGIFLSFTINFIFGSLCFWVENSWGISNFRHVVVGFLSGAILPLDLISIRLSRLSLYFPFAGIVYIPAGILTDQFEKQNIGVLLLIQICWVLILWVIGKLIYQKVKRLVVINGG